MGGPITALQTVDGTKRSPQIYRGEFLKVNGEQPNF